MIISITSGLKANGRPSTIGSNTLNIDHSATHVFTVANFTSETTPAYVDPEGDSMSYIKIITLPSSGELQLNGSPISINNLIQSGDISSGNFTYVSDSLNETAHNVSFQFDVADVGSETLSGLSSGIMNISIAVKANQPPSNVDDSTINSNNGLTIVFSSSDFTNGYSDPEGDNPYSVKITSLPSTGELRLDGVAVILNQEILISEIEAGYLTFYPGANPNTNAYQETIGFEISDEGSKQFTS